MCCPQPPIGTPRQACSLRSAMHITTLILQFALGGLFLFAAWNKLHPALEPSAMGGPQNFADSVRAFKLGLPEILERGVISITPWIEVVAGLALMIGLWRKAAAAVLAGLLLVFIALIVSVLVRNLNVECGCFGKLSPFCDKKIGTCNIIQNSIMLATAIFLILAPASCCTRSACGNTRKTAAV